MNKNTKSKAASGKEKRQARRVPLNVKVDCQSEGNFLFERASNISEHGIFIRTDKPLPLGTEVKLQFNLPNSKQQLKVIGEVAWVNQPEQGKYSHDPGMGVRFLQLSEIDRATLLNTIKCLAVL